MKFKNKETGTIHEVSTEICVGMSFCKDIRCRNCKLNGKADECTKWVLSNPKEAAQLMGYELIPDIKGFRNPRNGEIYDYPVDDCCSSGFCRERGCLDCPIHDNRGTLQCRQFVNQNPARAAQLMGYELITDLPEEPVEPQKEAPEMVSKEGVYNDLIGLEVSLTAASFNAAYGRNPTPDFTVLRKKLTDMKAKYQSNSCPLCRPGGVIYRTVKGKNGGLKGLCGTVDELNFCPGCGKPLNDKGRQIQKKTLDCAAEEAAKLV